MGKGLETSLLGATLLLTATTPWRISLRASAFCKFHHENRDSGLYGRSASPRIHYQDYTDSSIRLKHNRACIINKSGQLRIRYDRGLASSHCRHSKDRRSRKLLD